MSLPTAVLLCPGRGSYTKDELGFVGRTLRPGPVALALDACDDWRRSQQKPTLREIDGAEKFRPGLHLEGENAAELIYFGTLAQLEHLRASGVEFLVRGNHGMTHSVYVADPDGNGIEVLYDLPAEVWEGDVDAALSYFENLPRDGEEALEDSTDYPVFGRS